MGMRKRSGFTLIELLVVIAILALLVSILAPALAKARLAARKVISLANINQIGIAARLYGDDNRGFMPITGTFGRGIGLPGQAVNAWCTWSFGGKNNDGQYWAGSIFDVEAADRPLNPYVYPEITWEAPPFGALPANHPARKLQQAPVFKDPSDKATRQRDWPEETPAVSSYDDVGTSYHWSYRWFYPPGPPPGLSFTQRFNWGLRQMRIADGFLSSRFCWVYDQTADVVVNLNRNFVNGYGDVNRSVMGFLDGHGAYLTLERGATSGQLYTLVFQYQRR
jgi:prepilin-type N-terminal cleavage/methylation domain-containing protein